MEGHWNFLGGGEPEFSGGRGGAKPKTFCGGSTGIFSGTANQCKISSKLCPQQRILR